MNEFTTALENQLKRKSSIQTYIAKASFRKILTNKRLSIWKFLRFASKDNESIHFNFANEGKFRFSWHLNFAVY